MAFQCAAFLDLLKQHRDGMADVSYEAAHAPAGYGLGGNLLSRSKAALEHALGSDCVKIIPEATVFEAQLLETKNRLASPLATYKPKVLETYGDVPYYRPDGWWQFPVPPWYLTLSGSNAAEISFEEIDSWAIAYHGTDCEKLAPIMSVGLRKPGDLPGIEKTHGQARAGPKGAMYLSPSLWYSSHPVYSPLKRISKELWIQAVLKFRVRPNSYRVEGNTLGQRHWPKDLRFDPNFEGHSGLEWLLEGNTSKRCDAVIVGLMVREVGANAHETVFGGCPELGRGPLAPEYMWTTHLQHLFRDGGYLVTNACPRKEENLCDSRNASSNIYSPSMDSAQVQDLDGMVHAENQMIMALSRMAVAVSLPKDVATTIRQLAWEAHVRGQRLRGDGSARQEFLRTLKLILAHAEGGEDLTVDDLLSWHRACLKMLHARGGKLREKMVRFGKFTGVEPEQVREAIGLFCADVSVVASRLDLSGSVKAAWCAFHFVRIHPFDDGNGRLSRLLSFWALARHGLPKKLCAFPLFDEGDGITSRKAYIQAIGRGLDEPTQAHVPLASHIYRCLFVTMQKLGALPADLPMRDLAAFRALGSQKSIQSYGSDSDDSSTSDMDNSGTSDSDTTHTPDQVADDSTIIEDNDSSIVDDSSTIGDTDTDTF